MNTQKSIFVLVYRIKSAACPEMVQPSFALKFCNCSSKVSQCEENIKSDNGKYFLCWKSAAKKVILASDDILNLVAFI